MTGSGIAAGWVVINAGFFVGAENGAFPGALTTTERGLTAAGLWAGIILFASEVVLGFPAESIIGFPAFTLVGIASIIIGGKLLVADVKAVSVLFELCPKGD